MKLKALKKIKNIRSFISFASNHEFGTKRNIIYAVNGLGKTNISRLLQHVSEAIDISDLKSKEADSEVEFQLIADDDQEINEMNYKSLNLKNVVVFNSDFIEDNVRTADWSAKDVDGKLELELGEDQQKLKDLISQREQETEKFEECKKSLEIGLKEKIDDIKLWDPKNRKTLEKLVYDNLNKENYIKFKSQEQNYTDEQGKDAEGWVNSKANFDEIKDLDPESNKIASGIKQIDTDSIDLNWIEEQFKQSITFTQPPTEELKEHIEKITTEWIRTGLKYNKDDIDFCPFCRVELGEKELEVIKKYQEHVDSLKTVFDDKCKQQVKNIELVTDGLKKINNDPKAIVELRSKNLNIDASWQNLDVANLEEYLEQLKDQLERKRKTPDEILIEKENNEAENDNCIKNVKSDISSLNANIKHNNDSITAINNKLAGITVRQTELRDLLGKKYLSEFYENHKDSINKRDEIQKVHISLEKDIKEAQRALPSVEVAEKIVELFNIFMGQIGISKYAAEMKGTKIILKLEGTHDISSDAYKLVSEGEKNAIALCYFLSSSIRQLNSSEKFSQAVFVIDDPICSMNYKYFYGACNVLKNFHKVIQRILCGNESSPCPQLFLMTHNIQLFNMISSNVFKKDACYFELEINNGGHTLRRLKDEEKLSDFKTALRRIKGCAENHHNENIANDIRRVMETLCRFHGYILDDVSIKKIFPAIQGDLLMMAHDASHGDPNNDEDPFDAAKYIKMPKDLSDLMHADFLDLIDKLPAYE